MLVFPRFSPRPPLRRGHAVTELMLAYGAQALLIALALGLVTTLYLWINRSNIASDALVLSSAVHKAHASAPSFADVGAATIARSGILGPVHVTTASPFSDLVPGLVAAGGDVRVGVASGGSLSGATAFGTLTDRSFLMQFGDSVTPLTEEDCVTLAQTRPPGLAGLQIAHANSALPTLTGTGGRVATPGTATALSAPVATLGASTVLGPAATWILPHQVSGNLGDLHNQAFGDVLSWCDTVPSSGRVVLYYFQGGV